MQLHFKGLCKELFRLLVIAALVLTAVGTGTARADPAWTQTSQADFESGTLFQVDTSSSPGDVKLAAVGADGNYVYAFRGDNSKDFWRYDILANSWTSLADAPSKVKHGGALTYDGGNYIYAFRGNYSHDFWRYDISANSWTSLAYTPSKVKYGGSLAYDGSNYIYAFRGNNSKSFWRYDISANSWAPLVDTPEKVRYGGAITYNGSGYVYGLRGNDSQDFWRYDVSANSWTSRANTPDLIAYGGALAYDGSNYIYAFRGNDFKNFWRYDISANSWTSLVDTPEKVRYGGAITYNGSGYVYGLRGNYFQDFWRYDVSANSWTSRANTPASVYSGGALTMGGVSYQSSGNLTSSTHDTVGSADFGSISWTATTPASTSIKFQIATNSDNSTWSFKGPDGASGTYYTSSGTSIWTGHDNDRYIKYEAFLSTSDSGVTPTLHDVSITYTQQLVLPTVTTSNATLVEETTATLHGTITNDGGEASQYRFQWGTTQGGPYTDNISWTGSKTTGQSFSANLTGLSKGTKYYFIAEAKNSAGIGSSSELSFLTKPDPPVNSTFSAAAVSSTQIDLTWTMGEGAYRTMIRRKTGDFPVDRNDGSLVYFDTGTGVSDTGLSPATTYYYRAWSEVTGSQQWSDGYASASATTSSGGPAIPTAVGGEVYPVNKASVLAPWLFPFAVLSLAIVRGVLSLRRRAHSFYICC